MKKTIITIATIVIVVLATAGAITFNEMIVSVAAWDGGEGGANDGSEGGANGGDDSSWGGGVGGEGGCCGVSNPTSEAAPEVGSAPAPSPATTDTPGQTSDGNSTDSDPVPESPALPVCVLSAHPNEITLGQSSQISWQAHNAVSASINEGIGSVPLGNHSRMLTPGLGTRTYTMDVRGNDGSTVSCYTTIIVTQQPVVVPVVPNCVLSADPNYITLGQSAQLSWQTNDATSATINQGIGSVALGNHSRMVTPTSVGTFPYRMTVTNGTQSDTCATEIVVTTTPTPRPFTCENDVSFTASSRSIDRGDSTTLSWTVTRATSVAIDNGVNTNNALTGSVVVSPRDDITYTLTATRGATTVHCPITIDVDTDNGGGGGGGSSAPRCELKASDRTVDRGDRVTLTWETSRATKVEIRDNHNRKIISTVGKSTREREDLYDDSIVVRPERDTTYTLTASRGSRDRECSVRIDVDDDIVVTEIRDQQPLVVSIPLTSVPYTGVDAKDVAQMSVLGLIALWGAYLAWSGYQRRKLLVVQS